MLISFHPNSVHLPAKTPQTKGFKTFPTDDIQRIADCILKCTWSPIVFKQGHRKGENFISSSFLAFDFESPDYSLEQALEHFCDMQHVIGTTDNHQVAKPNEEPVDRFRVVIPWETDITDPDVYIYNMRINMTGRDCDKKCGDTGRHYYRCKEIISVQTDGYVQEVKPLPPQPLQDPFAKTRAYANMGFLGLFTKQCLTQVIPKGDRNSASFRMGCQFAMCKVDSQDAVARVRRSPTFSSMADDEFREFERAVLNGYLTEGAVTGENKSRRT